MTGAQGVTAVVVPTDSKFVVVVSHDCEFNEGKRNKLLVARVEGVPGHLTAEQRDDLRGSNDVETWLKDHETLDGVDAFLLSAVPGAFDDEQVVAFTSITPLPMKMKDELYDVKRAEMNHESRVLFGRKLAWFFGRIADDVPDEEKHDAPKPTT